MAKIFSVDGVCSGIDKVQGGFLPQGMLQVLSM